MIRTPSNLELLLHCHYSPEPHPRLDAPAIKEGMDYLLKCGMVTLSGPKPFVMTTTDKGRFYIDHLMTIPFPRATWETPDDH